LDEEVISSIKNLKSFQSIEFVLQPGGNVSKTIDLMTSPGAVQLRHENASILVEDYNYIHELCHSNAILKMSSGKNSLSKEILDNFDLAKSREEEQEQVNPSIKKNKNNDKDLSASMTSMTNSDSTVVESFEISF